MKNQPVNAKTLQRIQLEKRRDELILKIATNKALLKLFKRNNWFNAQSIRYEAEGIRLDAEYDGISYQLFRFNPMVNPHTVLTKPTLLRLIRLKIQRR
jgi:hypothetical protein